MRVRDFPVSFQNEKNKGLLPEELKNASDEYNRVQDV